MRCAQWCAEALHLTSYLSHAGVTADVCPQPRLGIALAHSMLVLGPPVAAVAPPAAAAAAKAVEGAAGPLLISIPRT